MADTPLSIRTSDETKALFSELSERGNFENKGEFLSRLLILYQAENTKGSAPLLKPAIEAVETLTSRLLDVLNGAGAIIETDKERHRQELDGHKASYEETRALLQQRITALEQERTEFKQLNESTNRIKLDNEQLRRQNEELTRELQKQADVIQLQKDKEILELKQQHQLKAEEQQAKYAALIAEYENRVRDLLKPPEPKQASTKRHTAMQAET